MRFDLYAPLRPAAGAPLVVFFYGGNWDSGEKAWYRWVGQALASRGFLVAIPDYRRVPDVRFPAFLEDGAAAVAAARRAAPRFGGDPDRVALAGHSAGAWTAVMLALDARWLSNAGVPSASVRAALGLAGPYDFYPFDVPASIAAFGEAEDPLATQPLSFVRPDAPSLWLGHGDSDAIVRPRNSIGLAQAMTKVGGRAALRLYSRIDHVQAVLALSPVLRWRAPVLAEMADFIRRETATAPQLNAVGKPVATFA